MYTLFPKKWMTGKCNIIKKKAYKNGDKRSLRLVLYFLRASDFHSFIHNWITDVITHNLHKDYEITLQKNRMFFTSPKLYMEQDFM